jgi:hypothetical protein
MDSKVDQKEESSTTSDEEMEEQELKVNVQIEDDL